MNKYRGWVIPEEIQRIKDEHSNRKKCPACQGAGCIETGVMDCGDNEIVEACDLCGPIKARKDGLCD